MAWRTIRTRGDEILTKTCKEVKEMTARTSELIDDMIETLYKEDGVGLAAPQVGVLRRIVVIDVSEEEDAENAENSAQTEKEPVNYKETEAPPQEAKEPAEIERNPIVMINPMILEFDGEQTDNEGCLSVPGKFGKVTRPNYVKAWALDRDMNPFTIEGTGLLARAICHELDHLDGHLYLEKLEGPLLDVEEEARKQKEAEEQEKAAGSKS